MIEISFNGALTCVGASAVLIDTGVEKIVLDYGTKVREVPPKFPIPINGKPDYVFLSHAHLDHSGGLALFEAKGEKVPIYASSCTKELTELLLYDSIKVSREEGVELPFSREDVERTLDAFKSVNYKEEIEIRSGKVIFFDAGHIPGSAFIYLEVNNKKILYTGDFNTVDTRLINKCEKKLPEVDILITESTYSDRNHPSRKSQEKELINIINETLARDANCLIAGFAVGRLQEIILILENYGIDYPLYLDGMAKKATTIITKYKELLRSPDKLEKALEKVRYIHSAKERKRAIKQPSVILATSGMLHGGPIVWYIKKLYKNSLNSLVLTGWQLEGTPGKILLETGKFVYENLNLDIKMKVKRLDFSAHVGRDDLFKFIEKLSPEKVFCIHGDHTQEFASELREKGFDAIAPLANNRIFKID
ncbi:MAG: MBL fold metallo-hydrolase [Candidatus Aenigmatarchaeota archaeon]